VLVKIASKFEKDFKSQIRFRGSQYFRDGLCELYYSNPQTVESLVEGSDDYEVKITINKSKLKIHCDCPAFQKFGPCKHIWATLLAIDDKKMFFKNESSLKTLSGNKDNSDSFYFQKPKNYDEYEDGFWDEDDEEFEEYDEIGFSGDNYHYDQEPEPRKPKADNWKVLFEKPLRPHYRSFERPTLHNDVKYFFVLNMGDLYYGLSLKIEVFQSTRKKDGNWGVPRKASLHNLSVESMETDIEKQAMSVLKSSDSSSQYHYSMDSDLEDHKNRLLIPLLGKNDKLYINLEDSSLQKLTYDPKPWKSRIVIDNNAENRLTVKAMLVRESEIKTLLEVSHFIHGGFFISNNVLSVIEDWQSIQLLKGFSGRDEIHVSKSQRNNFLVTLASSDLKADLHISEKTGIVCERKDPIPVLRLLEKHKAKMKTVKADLCMDYGSVVISFNTDSKGFFHNESSQLVRFNKQKHFDALKKLENLGVFLYVNKTWNSSEEYFTIPGSKLHAVVTELVHDGWRVEGQKGKIRTNQSFSMSVSSGIDWFDVSINCEFDDKNIALPQILKALHNGESFVTLGDGTYGLLPQEWLQKYAPIARMGEADGDVIRFKNSQALLVDMLLGEQKDVDVDAKFTKICSEFESFDGIQPKNESTKFQGKLRAYQRMGLGWLLFLNKFGIGGCLADDMGLGKTVQIAALLDSLKPKRMTKIYKSNHKPSLIVAPRSVIYNWIDELKKFTPRLKVLDYTQTGRHKLIDTFKDYDIILATYGTLRRDIKLLYEEEFFYAILDEAQVIKNSSSVTAKASRLLDAEHRVALSGTPVENHLGELWSIFEFLNPGILGTSNVLKRSKSALLNPDEESIEVLRKALTPFILRRTKAQVAKDLPEKTEEFIYCDMEKKQKKLYVDLKNHYRASLLNTIESQGINKSKMHVLEALLRLRQTACHAGLVNTEFIDIPSVKLETLIVHIQEIIKEGHKCLVFSQFTQMLSLVCSRFEKEKMIYEYLDGKTRNRQEKVERFQNDETCKVFVISLKAGGTGLNLTAADYVYILDPWWNPAVEAQAIDRTHRIGQKNPVFAYRFICKDSVEEKIRDLQIAKKNLAESVLSTEETIMQKLSVDDIQMLFS
jgi:superfamily II DNA or RNA helicase